MFGLRRLSPRLPEFIQRYPKVALELDLSIEKVDIFAERLDVAVRIAESVEPGLVAFRLAPYRRAFCASPAYLHEHGAPRTPEDLASHNCLIGRGARLNASWPVQRNGETHSIPVSGNFLVNNGEVLRDAAIAGLGIMMGPRWQVEDDLAAGRLVELLPEFASTNRAIYAVLPRQGTLTPKVRAFVDFLKACCAEIH
jgi:DNA-binding transcriptional LysR family regulator